MKGAIAQLNRRFPSLKDVVPFGVRKSLMRAFFSNAREYEDLEDRRWILQTLLPAVAATRPRQVVWVGAAPYTFHYERQFDSKATHYQTMDIHPRMDVWGAKTHFTGSVEHIDRFLPAGSVDVVFLIGVYGFGLNTREGLDRALAAIRMVLKPGGLLVFSWNRGVDVAPTPEGALESLFEPGSGRIDLPVRTQFEEQTLVVELWTAK
jgi:SAM-dependent methyltransferase